MNAVKSILQSANGKFMTVTFKKKDGTMRTINGRAGVTTHLRGGVKTVSDDNYFTIYENNNGYRNVNYDTVTEIKTGGKVFTVTK